MGLAIVEPCKASPDKFYSTVEYRIDTQIANNRICYKFPIDTILERNSVLVGGLAT